MAIINRKEAGGIEKTQLILHIPQLQYPKSVMCFFKSLEQYSEKSVHDARRKVSYLYGVARDEMIFEQVVIYYANNQIIFSYDKNDIDISEQLLKQLDKEKISHMPLYKSFPLQGQSRDKRREKSL